ncbi:hypothetical protein K7432_018310 [Basidiobolus ranarum]|uniref:Uncharacterized protein n=1 Tax=Basidiobolus ranarum TaxID=34480 RepID=A0ABR2WCC5_9FUNG
MEAAKIHNNPRNNGLFENSRMKRVKGEGTRDATYFIVTCVQIEIDKRYTEENVPFDIIDPAPLWRALSWIQVAQPESKRS